MEKTLFNWYEDLKKKNIPVTPKMIKKKALEIKKFPDFIASKGWLEKFKRKFKLELSRESKCENNSNVIFNNVCEKKEDIYKGCYIKRGEGQREKNISYTYSADHLKGEN